ncbi:class I SAM-dependent methyltransferase, partial [Acinetobacter baumannii]
MDFNALSPNWDTDLRVKRAEAISAEIESYLGSGPLEMMEFGCGTGL